MKSGHFKELKESSAFASRYDVCVCVCVRVCVCMCVCTVCVWGGGVEELKSCRVTGIGKHDSGWTSAL